MCPCWEKGQIKGCSDLSHRPPAHTRMMEGEKEQGAETGGISSPDGWVCADHPLRSFCRVTR